MAEIVGSLFGVTPDMYERQQRQSALNEGIAMARLAPEDRAQAMIYSGAAGLGRAGGGLLGIEDPQMKLISARQSIIGQLDQTDPASLLKGAQMLTQMGDQQGAFALADYARKAQSELALAQQRIAEKMTPEQRNAMAFASSVAEKGTPQYNQAYQQTLNQLISKEKPELTSPEMKNAKALALLEGPEGSPAYNAKYSSELARMTSKEKPEAKPNIQKLQEYAATLQPGSPLLAQVQAVIKAESLGRGVTLNMPPQEKAFEGGLGAGQSKKILEDKTSALDAAAILETNQVAKDLLKSGVITGTGANFFVGLNSALQQAGLDFGYADAASNSQAYVSAMGANVGRLIKQFGAGTGLSNADREYAEKMAGGQITLTESALRKIIDINDRAANRVIDLHNRNVKDIKTNIPLTVEKPTRTQPARTAVEQIPTQQGVNMTPMYARNPETNQRIMSTDGGKTWQPAR